MEDADQALIDLIKMNGDWIEPSKKIMKLYIKILNEKARSFYENHGHFHDGDAGLDLYVLEDIEFAPGETKLIKLGISCQPENGIDIF